MERPRIIDLLRIITLLQGRRYLTVRDLAEECGKSERGIYRDLKAIRETGIPVRFDRQQRGYRIDGDFSMPPVHLTAEEGLAIFALCEHLAQGEQVPFLRPAWEAAHKLLSSMPASIVNEVNEQSRHIAIRTGPAMPDEDHRDVYDRVQEALRHRRALECRYDSASSERSGGCGNGGDGDDGAADERFILEPYSLFFSVRAWYVIGRRSDRKELRCMRLSRFRAVTLTGQRYEIPKRFSLESYLGNAWRMMPGKRDARVELYFDAEVAPTVGETRWHRTQEVDEKPDGSCIFRCTVSGFDEIAWWILGYGPHCRVLRPLALRDRVRDLIAEMASIYEGAAAPLPKSLPKPIRKLAKRSRLA